MTANLEIIMRLRDVYAGMAEHAESTRDILQKMGMERGSNLDVWSLNILRSANDMRRTLAFMVADLERDPHRMQQIQTPSYSDGTWRP